MKNVTSPSGVSGATCPKKIPGNRFPLRLAALLATVATAIPGFGAEPPTLGIGMGPSTPFVMERPAPASAVVFKGVRTVTLDAPNISLNSTGDWSLFVAV